MAGYLTLDEAAIYATNKNGFDVTSSELLRAGVYGILLLAAPFGFGTMYNATESKEENFKAQLLIIPPSHLMEIETEGSARIMAAFSVDGKKLYFPHKEVTRCKIRVLIEELDRFLINLIQTNKEPLKETKLTEPATAKNATKLEKQHEAILEVIALKGFKPLEIPDGEKGTIEDICRAEYPLQFDKENSFKCAWDKRGDKFKMANHASYAKRGKQ